MTNFQKRFFSSIILLPLSFFIIFQGNLYFQITLLFFLIISLFEWMKMNLNIFIKIFGVIFIFFSFYSMHQIRNSEGLESLSNFLIIFLICVSSDLGGYFFGKIFKGPKLTKISPKKTYAGVIGGFIFSLLIIYFFIEYIDVFYQTYDLNLFLYIILVSSCSQLGDLIISYFKRKSKIKDTGTIIPGHGGVLDRIDSMIFAFPIIYMFKYFI